MKPQRAAPLTAPLVYADRLFPVDFATRAGDKFCLGVGFRHFVEECSRRRQGARLDDIDVGSFLHESPDWRAALASRKLPVISVD